MYQIKLYGGKHADLTLQTPGYPGEVVVVDGYLYLQNPGRVDDRGYHAYSYSEAVAE